MKMRGLAFLSVGSMMVMYCCWWWTVGRALGRCLFELSSLPARRVNRELGTYLYRPQDFRFDARMSMLPNATGINPPGAHLHPAPAAGLYLWI